MRRKPLTSIELADGSTVSAANYVFACGPWLPKVFPRLLGPRIFPTRQEVFFFAPPAGDARFGAASLPGWADFNNGDIYYGMPDLEGRGFKIAHDKHGQLIDPDRGDRVATPGALADVRAYMAKRFPALAGAPLNEERVCQYENSSNGDLLIDRHPTASQCVVSRRGLGPRLQARARSRPLRVGIADGQTQEGGTAVQSRDEIRSAEPRRALMAAPPNPYRRTSRAAKTTPWMAIPSRARPGS